MTPAAIFLWIAAGAPFAAQSAPADSTVASQILDELRQIRHLVEVRAAPATLRPKQVLREGATVKLKFGARPVLGSADAPLTVIEFGDYQCPACQRFQLMTFPLLKRQYIESGKLRYVSWDLPLVEVHSAAMLAAQAARCGAPEGEFWILRDQIQRLGQDINLPAILSLAARLGIDVTKFQDCLDRPAERDAVQKDLDQARAFGILAAPSFIIGRSAEDGVEGELVVGPIPYAVLSAKLRSLLQSR